MCLLKVKGTMSEIRSNLTESTRDGIIMFRFNYLRETRVLSESIEAGQH
jgi:hypothetical protein